MIRSLIRKEFRQFFNSPIAYITMTFFLVLLSVLFFVFQDFFAANVASLRGYFGIMPIIFIFLIPSITMRSWAEERKQGSYELLVTLPFRNSELVIGKFLGSYALFSIMMLLTIPIPVSVSFFGSFEIGEIIGEYLAMFLVAAASISIGTFISSVSTNQISAFIMTVLVLCVLTLVGTVPSFIEMPRLLARFLRYISFNTHYDALLKGLIDTRDLVYFAIIIAGSLILTVYTIETRKEN